MRSLALAVLVPLAFLAGGSGLSLVLWCDWLRGFVIGSTILELAGLVVAGLALDRKRVQFGGGTPLSEMFSRWVRRLIGRPRIPPVTLQVDSLSHAVLTDRVDLVVKPGPNASLERRIELLEGRADDHDERFREVEKRFREDLRRATEKYQKNLAASEQRLRAVEDRLSHLVADGAGFEALGLWWLALGVVSQSIVTVVTWTS